MSRLAAIVRILCFAQRCGLKSSMSAELAEGALNILHTDKVIYYSYVSDIEAIEACIRFLNVT